MFRLTARDDTIIVTIRNHNNSTNEIISIVTGTFVCHSLQQSPDCIEDSRDVINVKGISRDVTLFMNKRRRDQCIRNILGFKWSHN